MRACAFFPPSLNPILNGRKGHKDAVVAPQVPTRWAVGQAVLDHEPHRQIDHAVGVLTARWRQIRQVSLEVLLTFRTVVLRIGDDEIPWTPQVEIAQVVQRPLKLLVPIG
jgi:predicted component of type VI protein secretion system